MRVQAPAPKSRDRPGDFLMGSAPKPVTKPGCVYVVTRYDHSIFGIFGTAEAADAAVKASNGYLYVDERELDVADED